MDDIVLGAKQFPNPNNVKSKADTDAPDLPKTGKMDVSNPPSAQIVPRKHPLEEWTQPTKVRHPLGRGVPKIQISDN